MPWEPNVGKWFDDENYEMKEPLWQRLLRISSQYENEKRLREILSWFGMKNMYGDYYKVLLLGCFLYKVGVNLEEYISANELADIVEIAKEGKTIDECAIHLLKKEKVDDEFIDEFQIQFAEKNYEASKLVFIAPITHVG